MDQFPLGVEFYPTPEEVIRYLQSKLDGEPVFPGTVCDFDVYSQHPKQLPGDFQFFFTPRHRSSGNNARRSIPIGRKQICYWHTNNKINIYREPDEPEAKAVVVGQMTAFSFKIGTAGTDWLMHEYLLPEVPGEFQEWAICKVYNKREDRINANKGKGKPLLDVQASSCGDDVSDFDSKRRKLNDGLMIQKVTPGQICEDFGFMPEANQLYFNNISNACNFTSGHDPEASTSKLPDSCNQVMMPPLIDENQEFNQEFQPSMDKNQLYCMGNLATACREADSENQLYCMGNLATACGEADSENQLYHLIDAPVSPLIIGSNFSVQHHEEDALQQMMESLQGLLEEGSDFGKGNPTALDDTDGGLWYPGDHAQDPSPVLSFPPEQGQIVHHSAAAENLPPQPLVASSNDGSQLSTDDHFSTTTGLQFSTDGTQYNNGIPELSNFIADDWDTVE